MIRANKYANTLRKLVKVQLITGFLAVLILTISKHNLNTIISGLIGLFIAIIPTYVYAKIAISGGLVVNPALAYSRHKKAMVGRFVLNLILFALVTLCYRSCDFVALFIVYFATLAGYWISLLK